MFKDIYVKCFMMYYFDIKKIRYHDEGFFVETVAFSRVMSNIFSNRCYQGFLWYFYDSRIRQHRWETHNRDNLVDQLYRL